nr:MAG TPA: hypothetical protein [Caudoviricetes sp.]
MAGRGVTRHIVVKRCTLSWCGAFLLTMVDR